MTSDAAAMESLVVRFTGDAESYMRMLRDAQAQTAETARQVGEHASKIEGFAASLKTFGQAVMAGLTALGLGRLFGEAQSAWDEREQGIIRLNAALRANNRNVEETTATYRQFAQSQAQVTTNSAGMTMDLLRTAETFGLTGDAAQSAVRDAQALSAATGRDAESMLRVSSAMAQGNTEMLEHMARMIPQLRNARDESERLAVYQRLVATGMGTAAEMAATNNHQLTQASRAVKALLGDIGQLIDEAMAPMATILKDVAEWVRNVSSEMKGALAGILTFAAGLSSAWAVVKGVTLIFGLLTAKVWLVVGALLAVGAAIGAAVQGLGGWGVVWGYVKEKAQAFWDWLKPAVAAGALMLMRLWETVKYAAGVAWDFIKSAAQSVFDWFGTTGADAVTAVRDAWVEGIMLIEFGIYNFGDVARLVWKGVELGWTVLVETVKHFFTAVLPALLSWFGSNFPAIFRDAFNLVGTVTSNYFRNLYELFRNLPEIIRGSVNPRDIFVPLTQGFTATLRSLPNIPAREMGAVERRLREEFASMAGAFHGDFMAFREQRLREIDAFWGSSGLGADAARAGTEAGQRFGDGFRGGIDAVLRYSAEAFARVAAYREQVLGGGRAVTIGGGGGGVANFGGASAFIQPALPPIGASIPAPGPVAAGRPDNGQTAIIAQLALANTYLDRIANQPQVVVEAADLEA